MQLMGVNYCDFCFSPLMPGQQCTACGLTHENYKASAGLLKPGTNLMGKYIIGRALGRGGFGVTYVAFSAEKRRPVAIKEFFPTGIACRGDDDEHITIVSKNELENFQKGAARFFEEAQTLSKFNMVRNIVSVYEFFHANDTAYYAMEYLDGIDLKGYASKKGGRITPQEAMTVLRCVCDALVSVHSTGTLHRDISPDNIFICTDGTVKLIDFGAAKQVISERSQNLSVILKQGFAPLEQYKKDGNQGMWTDIYALGATIYYSLTGKIPDDPMSRLENPDIVFDPSLNIPQGLVDIINKCLKVRIEDRYQSAMEVLEAMSALNIEYAPLGEGYVQEIFNGTVVAPTGLEGVEMKFDDNLGYYVPVEPDNSGLVKGIIVAACAVVILIIGIVVASQL